MKLQIDIDNTPQQTFSADLGGVTYDFALSYKALLNRWVLSCYTQGAAVFEGVGLVCGINLLSSLDLKEFGALYIEGEEPTLDNLGTHSKLVWVSHE